MSLAAGLLGYTLAKKFKGDYFVAGITIATVISISESWKLNQLFSMPFLLTLPSVFISEQIVCFVGACIFKVLETRYVWWKR